MCACFINHGLQNAHFIKHEWVLLIMIYKMHKVRDGFRHHKIIVGEIEREANRDRAREKKEDERDRCKEGVR